MATIAQISDPTAVQLGPVYAPQAPSPARQWASRLATDAELKEHIRMFKAELGERQRIRARAKYIKAHPDLAWKVS